MTQLLFLCHASGSRKSIVPHCLGAKGWLSRLAVLSNGNKDKNPNAADLWPFSFCVSPGECGCIFLWVSH